MKNLTHKDFQKINETIIAYQNLSKNIKDYVDKQFNKKWCDAMKQYKALCQSNPIWLADYTTIHDYEDVTSFDLDHNFEITVGDSEDRCRVYSASLKADYQNAYDHLNEYRAQIQGKLTKLDQQRFALGKKLRNNFLHEKLNTIESKAAQYAEWQQKDRLKNEYLANKTQPYRAAKARFQTLEKQLAMAVLSEQFKTNAVLACKTEHPTINTSFEIDGNTYKVNSDALHQVCNDIHYIALTHGKQVPETEPTRE